MKNLFSTVVVILALALFYQLAGGVYHAIDNVAKKIDAAQVK